MDAHPILARIAALLERHKLEAILIGNAAAALQGAAVTTIDIDFLFRRPHPTFANSKPSPTISTPWSCGPIIQ